MKSVVFSTWASRATCDGVVAESQGGLSLAVALFELDEDVLDELVEPLLALDEDVVGNSDW
jgi:hypothetical protein